MPITPGSDEYNQLTQLIPLNTLKQEAFDGLLEHIELSSLGKNEIIFREGDVDHVNIYLLAGDIRLLSHNTEMDRLSDSGTASKFPVAHQIPRKYTAKTAGNVQIARIDSRRLSEALAENEKPDIQVDNSVDEAEDDSDWMTQLLQSRVMQHIPASNLQGVMMRMVEVEVQAGETVITEGDEGDYFYLLHRGEAAVLKHDAATGQDNEVAMLFPGAAFGEDALLSNRPRSSTVKMATDGILVRLSKDDFIELIKHPLSAAVSYEEALAIIDKGGIWIDVRDHDSYDAGHLPGAINMPHATLRFQLDSLDEEREYVIYSQTGTRALSSAYVFLERGMHASTLEGGYNSIQDSPASAEEAPVASAEELATATIDSAELDTLKQQLTELQSLLATRDEALGDADKRVADLTAQLQSASDTQTDPKALLQLENKNKKLEREIIGLTEQLESQEDSYDALKEQHERLESDHKKHLRQRDLAIGEIKEQITVLQLERDEALSELAELQNNDGGSALSEAHHVNEIEQLEALNANISNERDNQKYEIEDLRNQLSLARQEISELQLEITDLKGRLSEQTLSTGTEDS